MHPTSVATRELTTLLIEGFRRCLGVIGDWDRVAVSIATFSLLAFSREDEEQKPQGSYYTKDWSQRSYRSDQSRSNYSSTTGP